MKSLNAQLQKYKRIIILLLVVMFILVLVLIGNANRKSSAADLTIETVQIRNVEKKVTADGNVSGVDKRFVYFTPNQKVTEIRVNIGDQVNQDDVLAVLTTVDGRNSTTEIKAPISGIVTESNYKQNDLVSSVNSAGFTLVDKSTYKIELAVNENDIVDLKAGQSAKIIYSPISIDTQYKAEVERVYPDSVSGSSSVSYKVVVKPTEIPDGLKLGMSANVEILTAKAESVLSVPESFLVEKDNKIYLKFLTWDNTEKTAYTVAEKEVQIGLRTDEYVEIKSGASENDQIVEPNFVPKKLSLFGN